MSKNFQLIIAFGLIAINFYDIYHVGFEWKHAFFIGFASIFIFSGLKRN